MPESLSHVCMFLERVAHSVLPKSLAVVVALKPQFPCVLVGLHLHDGSSSFESRAPTVAVCGYVTDFCVLLTRHAESFVLILFVFFCCREAEMRNSILAQVLDQSARARCKHLQFLLFATKIGFL